MLKLLASQAALWRVEKWGTFSAAGAVPEASTWAMVLLGFAGLGFSGYRASRKCSASMA